MPYCCQCGTPAGAVDKFCAKCGAKQPVAPGTSSGGDAPQARPADFLGALRGKHAALLCYIPGLGWIAAIIVLASRRYKRDTPDAREVRFHAFQGLYLFVAWLIVDWVASPALRFGMGIGHAFAPLGALLHLLVLAAWIVMLIKVSHWEHYRLPIIGEMAERSVEEQRV
jgi:uncharacterized membrane protein